MVDFIKLAQGNKRGGESLVSNSNVLGDSDLFKNFDLKMSQINLGDFGDSLRSSNTLGSQSKVVAQPENYLIELEKQEINQVKVEIQNSFGYMGQNEQYSQYQERIKQLLRENECSHIGELLSKHGDSKQVIAAMSTLQQTFDADPKLKKHYEKTMINFKNLNNKFNEMRGHIHRGEQNGVEAVKSIATHEYSGNVANAVKSYQSDMVELNDMRNEAIHNINETLIPFVDDQGKYVVDDFENNLKEDQESLKAVSEIDINKPDTKLETHVESTQSTPDDESIELIQQHDRAVQELIDQQRMINQSGPSL